MVWSETFDYANYNIGILISLAFCVEYESYDNIAPIVKECKNKKRELAKYFPPWLCHETKMKKDRNKVLDSMPGYKGKDKVTLKLWFLRECLKNKYFGSVDFLVHTVVPNSDVKEQQEVLLVISEAGVVLRDQTSHEELFVIKTSAIRRWRPVDQEKIIFLYFTDSRRKSAEFSINNPRALLILDHLNSFMNLLKDQKVRSKTDELGNRLTQGFHTTNGTSASTMSVLMRNDRSLSNMSLNKEGEGDWPAILPRVEFPLPQRATFTDPDSFLVPVAATETAEEFGKLYDPNENGWTFADLTAYHTSDNLIEQGCLLIRNAIQKGISSTLIGQFLGVHLPNDPGMLRILTQYLDGPWDAAAEIHSPFRVGLAATCLENVMHTQLPPLDAFVALNYVRSLLLDYGQKQWKDFDFVGNAAKIDEKLGTVVTAALGVMHRVNHPLSTVLFEAMSASMPEAQAQLMLNRSIADGLLMIGVAVAQSLCDASIREAELRPLMDAVPEVPTFEPIFATRLSEVLLPIIRETAGSSTLRASLLAQPHVARVEPNSMVKAVQDLYALTHFMNSPLAMFIHTKSPQLSTILTTPTTMSEAVEVYKTVREMALVMWTMDETENGALAYELSERAATMYALFCSSRDEQSPLAPLAVEQFKLLEPATREGLEFAKTHLELTSLLNPSDPLQNLALGLISINEDWQTAAALLAIAAMDEKQVKALVASHGEQIDVTLRGMTGPLAQLELDQFNNLFKFWSLGVLSCAPPDQGSEIRAKIAEIGGMLMTMLGDWGMAEEARKESVGLVRNLLRPLRALGEEGEQAVDVLKQFLDSSGDPSKMRPYEAIFSCQAPDLTVPIAIIKKVKGVLTRFQRTRRAN
jgi:hypothetical protein